MQMHVHISPARPLQDYVESIRAYSELNRTEVVDHARPICDGYCRCRTCMPPLLRLLEPAPLEWSRKLERVLASLLLVFGAIWLGSVLL